MLWWLTRISAMILFAMTSLCMTGSLMSRQQSNQ